MGRPKRYLSLIMELEQDLLYSPSMIARMAGPNIDLRRRVRITMARYATKHKFPDYGDGIVVVAGQAPTPGWYGWRWQETYGENGGDNR